MENEVTVIRFHYHKEGDVADALGHDFGMTIAPPRNIGGSMWKEGQDPYISVCIAVHGTKDDAKQYITELTLKAEEWLRNRHPHLNFTN